MKNSFYQKEISDFPKSNGNEPTCLHIISRECRVTQMPLLYSVYSLYLVPVTRITCREILLLFLLLILIFSYSYLLLHLSMFFTLDKLSVFLILICQRRAKA